MGKYLIRKAFADDHLLPDEILWRQKAAFSDAVGHSMVDDLKAYADAQFTQTRHFDAGCARYDFRPPLHQAKACSTASSSRSTIPARPAWSRASGCPIRAWPGCAVADPSARVLAELRRQRRVTEQCPDPLAAGRLSLHPLAAAG